MESNQEHATAYPSTDQIEAATLPTPPLGGHSLPIHASHRDGPQHGVPRQRSTLLCLNLGLEPSQRGVISQHDIVAEANASVLPDRSLKDQVAARNVGAPYGVGLGSNGGESGAQPCVWVKPHVALRLSRRCPSRREELVEINGLLSAAVNLITAVILWQAASRNEERNGPRAHSDWS